MHCKPLHSITSVRSKSVVVVTSWRDNNRLVFHAEKRAVYKQEILLCNFVKIIMYMGSGFQGSGMQPSSRPVYLDGHDMFAELNDYN